MAKDHKDTLIPSGTAHNYGTDFMDQEAFGELVEQAADRAREIVAGTRTGTVTRTPRDGKCPQWCEFAPICRMERGAVEVDEVDEEDERV